MDAAKLALVTAEINALPTFLSTYDTGVSLFLSGTNTTCPHFLDTIQTLSNNETYTLCCSASLIGQGAAYGRITDFVYTVAAIQRNMAVLPSNKAFYYSENDTVISTDASNNAGDAAKVLSYMLGNSPDQGVLI
jgi:hypothetical protein